MRKHKRDKFIIIRQSIINQFNQSIREGQQSELASNDDRQTSPRANGSDVAKFGRFGAHTFDDG